MRLEPIPPRQLGSGRAPRPGGDLPEGIGKRPADRYASAREMAGDLRRFLEGRPILARIRRAAGRLGRWLRRHPARFGMGLLVVAGLSLVASSNSSCGRPAAGLTLESRRELRRIVNRVSEADLHRAVELGESRIQDQPESREPDARSPRPITDWATSCVNTDQLADASRAYERAITLLRQHLRGEAGDVASRVELADVLSSLGEAFRARGQGPEARLAYEQALIVIQHPGLRSPRTHHVPG